jgi:hypothetical protein
MLVPGAEADMCVARKIHQAGEGGAASNQERAGLRAAEQDAAAAAKAQQEHVQEQAAELQWDPLGFRQVFPLACQCSIERCCDTVIAKPQAQTAHVVNADQQLAYLHGCTTKHAPQPIESLRCLLLVVQMPLQRHSQAGARTADQSGFKSSANEASSAAVMLKTLKRLNQVCW